MPETTDAGLAFMKRALDHPQPVSKLYNGTRDTAAADAGALAKRDDELTFMKRARANPRPLSEMYSGTRASNRLTASHTSEHTP